MLSPGGTSDESGTGTASGMEKVVTSTWKALLNVQGMQATTAICYPMDGDQLVEAVTGAECAVIMLTRDYFDPYTIKKEMVVSTPKVIIGNPLTLPALHPSKIERLFHGESGA